MLGLCCQWLDSNEKNTLKSRTLQLGRFNKGLYNDTRIKQTYVDNVNDLLAHLPVILGSGIKVFRMSSSMFPLWDKVPRALWDNDDVNQPLEKIGQFVTENHMRLTTHPGQFVVLSSPNERTRNNAIAEINFQSRLFDIMGFDESPTYAINVHGGGKSERLEYLVEGIKTLDERAAVRLTLENCEFGWSVTDLYDAWKRTGVPICFDSHHHSFNDGGMNGKEAMDLAMSTWQYGIKPLTHLSNVKEGVGVDAPATKRRAHSDYIYEIPEYQKKANNEGLIDIDVEAKKKNLAIFAMKSLGVKLT
jgi:UV DNA damage endonuclease